MINLMNLDEMKSDRPYEGIFSEDTLQCSGMNLSHMFWGNTEI